MKPLHINRRILSAIIAGTYSQSDLHEFVQVCYALALPWVRRRITTGRINLDIMGLRETDIVQDCLADLFRRGDSPVFPEIARFFNHHFPALDTLSEERILVKLRQLILGKCHNNLIRLHAEADPVLGKIIRNVMLSLDRTGLFDKCLRFGEPHIALHGADAQFHLPPMTAEALREKLLPVARPRDTIPQLMKKLHGVLARQKEFQRAVPVVTVSLIFKEVYAHGEELGSPSVFPTEEAGEVRTAIRAVIDQCKREMHKKYVGSGKRSADVFHGYMLALDELLIDTYVNGDSEDTSYCEYLQRQMPGLTKTSYLKHHRSVFEYLAKKAKSRARAHLEKMIRTNGNV